MPAVALIEQQRRVVDHRDGPCVVTAGLACGLTTAPLASSRPVTPFVADLVG
ncbi:MAG TPA: hypothetical protein VHN98_03840 [Acidimicrobiales bacterium]|nr:hypothetical protein [Acidimicrobiales bacterium]